MSELLDQCLLEARRCRKAIRKGSPAAFWRGRIKASLGSIDEARAVLQAVLDELEPRELPPRPDEAAKAELERVKP